VGLLELTLETATAGIHQQPQARQRITQALGQRQRSQFGRLAECTDESMGRAIQLLGYQLQGIEQQNQSLNAHGKANARSRLAAELADPPVVPTASTDGALCAKLIGDPLEHGTAVVIEAANQLRIDLVRDPHGIKSSPEPIEMSAGFVIE